MDDAVHVDKLVLTIDRIEDAPVADRILGQPRQVGGNGLVPQNPAYDGDGVAFRVTRDFS